MVKPPSSNVSAPSPDDDPTGVRALLSSMPEPDPMPDYLVERINASLAAEQAQRAPGLSGASVTPLTTTRRRRGRILFAIAGAAATVALVAVLGDSLRNAGQTSTVASEAAADRAADPSTSFTHEASGATPQSADEKTQPRAAAPAPAAGAVSSPVIQIRLSQTRYTQADFVAQARTLRRTAPGPNQRLAADSPGAGPMGTTRGLTDCLSAIGAGGAQQVQADLAFYQEKPAVIIVATANDRSVAYAVGRGCAPADTAIMHGATPLP